MARKKNVEKSDSDKSPAEMAGRALHGQFTTHPLFTVLQDVAIVVSHTPETRKQLGLDDALNEGFRQLGKWFFNACTKPEAEMRKIFEEVGRLAEHLNLSATRSSERQPVEKQRFVAQTNFLKLAIESGTAPSQKKLRAAVHKKERVDETERVDEKERADDDRTLRREIDGLGLPLANHKTMDRISNVAEKLSQGGRIKIAPEELRSQLQSGIRKMTIDLPPSDHELLALCACYGAKLEKKQLLQSFFKLLHARYCKDKDLGLRPRPVTDFDLCVSIPKWVRDHYGLNTVPNLRVYAESIGIRLTKEKRLDRDDIFSPAR